jgi:methionyl-tRNA formyltransferase
MSPSDVSLASPPDQIRRVAFLGTPDEAVVALRALVEAGFEVATVVTQPDRRRGRGARLDPSPVKAAALELGLDVAHDLSGLVELDVDLGVVVAYGRIIPVAVLGELAMVNIHFSLLPRWRGAAPVERAILAGDDRTGVCLMEVAEGLDEGGVYARVEVDIGPDESAADLRARLARIGARLLVERLQAGLGPARPQVGEVTYAAKLDRDEFRLDLTRPADEQLRVVRLGRAWTTFRGRRLGVLDARLRPGSGQPGAIDGPVVATPSGSLELIEVKPEGRRAQSVADWLNGARPLPGERLG